MSVANSAPAYRSSPIRSFLSSNVVQYLLFICVCAFAGITTHVVHGMGGLTLVTSALAFILFAILVMLNARLAIFAVFAFSLVQPVVTRLIFSVDYPIAVEQSMLGYKDPLTTTVSLLLIASAGLAIVIHARRHAGGIPGLLVGVIAFYTILNGLQCLNPSTSLMMGVYGAKNNIAPLLMLFAGSIAVRTPAHVTKFVKFIAWFSVVALSYGLYQEIWGLVGFEKHWHSSTVPSGSSMYLFFVGDIEVRNPYIATSTDIRVPSVFQGYTFYSYVIAAFGIIVYAAGQKFSTGIWKELRVVMLALLVLYFALSLERAAIIMFGIGVVAVHFAVSRERKRLLRFLFFGGIVVALFLTAFSMGTRYLVQKGAISGNSKLIRIVELTNPLTATTVASGRIRGHWPEAMTVIRAHPLTGTGAGTGMYTRATKSTKDIVMPHNEFLHKLLELGPIGLLCFVTILFLLYRLLMRECLNEGNTSSERAYATGMVGVLAAYLACGIMNVPFIYTPGVIFWFLAGAACGADRHGKSRVENVAIPTAGVR